MALNKDSIIYKDLSYKIIGLAMDVHNRLGCGFYERIYEKALIIMLQKEGLPFPTAASHSHSFRGPTPG